MPSRPKTSLSRQSRGALRRRLNRARETDEERSERLAAVRERQKLRYNKKKVNTQVPPISQVRIEDIRSLRPGADRRCSEVEWLKAVKSRMYSEKAWLAAMKERLNSERIRLKPQGQLDCEKVHCKPLLNSQMEPFNCENPSTSEKDLSNSEMDLSTSEQDSYASVEGVLNFPCLRENTHTAQDLESNEITIKEEAFND